MTAPNEPRDAVARTLRNELIARHDYDSTMRPCSWIDGIDEAADAILSEHIAPRDAEIERLRAERDDLKTALDEMIATIDPTIDLIERQRSWQRYGERLERDADAALADEIQTQRKRVVEMKAEVKSAEAQLVTLREQLAAAEARAEEAEKTVSEHAEYIIDLEHLSYIRADLAWRDEANRLNAALSEERARVAGMRERCAKIADAAEDNNSKADSPYDGGSGSCGYQMACRDIAQSIRALTPEPPHAA